MAAPRPAGSGGRPEARFDPVAGRWVILSPGRASRPAGAGVAGEPCPFCPGNEHLTPPEVARAGPGEPDGPGWRVRVVPNRFPIVGTGREPASAGDDAGAGGSSPGEVSARLGAAGEVSTRLRAPAAGAHEVVVLSPDHGRSLAELGDDEVGEVLAVLRDRSRHHAAAGRGYVQAIVNHGPRSGASLVHPHAQVVAVDLHPPAVLREVDHVVVDGRCVLCDEIRHGDGALLAVPGEPADVRVWCPWWSGTAFELLLAPRRHGGRFEDVADAELPAIARGLRSGLDRLRRAGGDPAYNLVVHSLPARSDADYHWHVHVWPRQEVQAGFELGTGLAVSTVDPAAAAAALRDAADQPASG